MGAFVPGDVTAATVASLSGIGLLVGFTEEVLFRGFLQKELERDYKSEEWKANVLVALLYASSHLSLGSFPGLALLSLCLSRVRKYSGGSLSFPIGLHSGLVATHLMMTDGGGFIQTAAGPSWLLEMGEGGALPAGLGILCLLYAALGLRWTGGRGTSQR